MAGRIRRALTFSNVCSFLALTIALGTGSAYAANTVFSTDIVDGEVKYEDIGPSSVTTSKIRAKNVRNDDLALDAVDSPNVLDGAVGNDDLADDSVGSNKVIGESLLSGDLGTNAVGATEISDNSIDGGEIVNNSLFGDELAGGSVRSSELQNGGVGNIDLASNAVTGSKVANNTITSSDIAGGIAGGTVSLSGVPNGRCTQVSIGVSGAAIGEVPLIATNASIQNGVFVYAMRVEAANSVEASVCNFSGGAMTPIVNMPVKLITID